MKVKELIEVLSTFDAELDVVIYKGDWMLNCVNIDTVYSEYTDVSVRKVILESLPSEEC